MTNELHDYSGRCGSCRFFGYRVVDGKLKKWGGVCDKPNRADYRDASQKACKMYEENQSGMTNKEIIQTLKNAAWLGTNEEREQIEQAVEVAINAIEQQEILITGLREIRESLNECVTEIDEYLNERTEEQA